MCKIIKFDKNFKPNNKGLVVSYMLIIGNSVKFYFDLSEDAAFDVLKDCKKIYSSTKMYKYVTGAYGSNEKICPLTIS